MKKKNLDQAELALVTTCQIINDKLVAASEVSLKVNNEAAYPEGDVLDFNLLKESIYVDGDFFLFNCSCGIPQCTGREKGVRTYHINDYTYWDDLDYGTKWIFESDTLRIQIKEIESQINQFSEYFKRKSLTYKRIKYNETYR